MVFNFYLRDASAKKESPVRLWIGGAKPEKVPLRIKVNPSDWDFKKQRTKRNVKLNIFMDNILKEAVRIHDEGLADGVKITKKYLKDGVLEYLDKVKPRENDKEPEENMFWAHYDEYVAYMWKVNAENTAKKSEAAYNHTKSFCKKLKVVPSYQIITLDFLDKFIDYLLYDKDTNLVNSSAFTVIINLRRFLSWAAESRRKYNTYSEFREFKVKNYEADTIALSQTELNKMVEYDFSDRTHLERIRDIFCLECYTGLRFSDIATLKPENIKKTYIQKGSIKTKDLLRIPLNKFSRAVLDKYSNSLPVVSQQKTNDYLKEIGSILEFNEVVELRKFKGNQVILETYKKHELIGTHTGRRTFITLSLEKGMRMEVVMKIAGIKSFETMKKYNKLVDSVLHKEMNEGWK